MYFLELSPSALFYSGAHHRSKIASLHNLRNVKPILAQEITRSQLNPRSIHLLIGYSNAESGGVAQTTSQISQFGSSSGRRMQLYTIL